MADANARWTWSRYYGFLFPLHAITAGAFLSSGHTLAGGLFAVAAFGDLTLIAKKAT